MNLKTLQSICFSVRLGLLAALASAAPFVSPSGYSLTLPPGWKAAPGHSFNDVIFKYAKSAATDGTPTFGVKTSPLPASTTLEAVKPALIADYNKRFSHVVILSQSYSSLGGIRDLDLVSTNVMRSLPLRLHQICVLRNGYVYIFSAAYLDRTHAKYDPMVAQILASVHWKA